MTWKRQSDRARVFARRLRNMFSRFRQGPDYSTWPTTEGEIYTCVADDQTRWHRVEIWYTYRALEQPWSGSSTIVFLDDASAHYYCSSRAPGSKVILRYNPAVPDRSVILESDQMNPNPVAVVMQERTAPIFDFQNLG